MGLSRRDWLRLSLAGGLGISASGWLPELAAATGSDPRRRHACILLWMAGGPSQLDTFDPKPGHENGGPFHAIQTATPGVSICEHLPRLARSSADLALIRSMSTKEGDHTRATYLLRTGYPPSGPVAYPSLGPLVGKILGDEAAELPNCVSIGSVPFISPGAFGPGFLGPRYAPLMVGGGVPIVPQPGANTAYEEQLKVPNLSLAAGIERSQADARLTLLRDLERDFTRAHPGAAPQGHVAAYDQADRMMRSTAVRAFELDDETAALRDAYGRNAFGQGCLLARRLIERGVPFVEVSLNSAAPGNILGWDTHRNNFKTLEAMLPVLDNGWATLLADLKSRGMLESTLVVWMGEFGRTPKINNNQGRDHFPNAWSTVLSGGGIRGGQVIGSTGDGGQEVAERPVSVPDLLATILLALGIDPLEQNMSNVGRPIRLADPEAKPLRECLL
jgi:hypothetical protein